MWKILVPLAILLLVVFIQLMRVEGFIDPACVRKPGAYSVRCTDGTILDPQGADVPSTCGYKPNITGVVTDPTGGICGSVPPDCKGWAYNGSGVWTNFNLVSNTGNPAKKGVGNRGTGGASLYGYSGSYLGNVDVDTSAVSAQLGSTWTGYSGTKPSFSTTTAAKPATAATTTTTTGTAAGTTTGTTAAKPITTILPPTTTTDASGNTVNTAGTGTINLSLSDLITLFGSTISGTSKPPGAPLTQTTTANNPAASTTSGQDFYNQFRPMLLDDINTAVKAQMGAVSTGGTGGTGGTGTGETTTDTTACSPSIQQGNDFSTAQNNLQYNQEYIRKDSIPCYACNL